MDDSSRSTIAGVNNGSITRYNVTQFAEPLSEDNELKFRENSYNRQRRETLLDIKKVPAPVRVMEEFLGIDW